MPRSRNQSLNPVILESALQGLEIQRNKLDEQIANLRALLGRRTSGRRTRSSESGSEEKPQPRRRKMSNAARKRIAAAQKKRWAAVRAKRG
jgi:peptidoglycan hydrolase CwlO-like protein